MRHTVRILLLLILCALYAQGEATTEVHDTTAVEGEHHGEGGATEEGNTTHEEEEEVEAVPKVPWEGWFILATLIVLVLVLFSMNINITAAITLLAIIYYLVPIIESRDLFVGFGNGGVVAIELFYVIMYPMASLPLVKRVGYYLMKGAEDYPRLTLLKVCFATMILSMWFDNPPHVAVMTTIILRYCVSEGISPAMFLLPVNFAATLGNYSRTGTLSNLIIYGIIEDLRLDNVRFFDLIKVNGPLILFELAYLVLVPPLLWGKRKGSFVSRSGETRFKIHLSVGRGSRLVGRAASTIAEIWGASNASTVDIVGVHKSDDTHFAKSILHDVGYMLGEGDRIVVTAPPTLIQSGSLYWGYVVTFHQGLSERRIAPTEPLAVASVRDGVDQNLQLSVVVLGQTAVGIGSTIGERTFTNHYGLEIVGCSVGGDVRNELDDEDHDNMHEHVLAAADSVLCYGSTKAICQHVKSHEFVMGYCINKMADHDDHPGHDDEDALNAYQPLILLMMPWWPWGKPVGRKGRRHKRIVIPALWRYMSLGIFIAIIVLDALEVNPLEVLLLIGAAAYILLGIISVHEAFHAIHLERYALAAFSFSLGVAFERSLFAEVIGETIARRHFSPYLNLFVISLLATVFTNLVTSEAAAQLMVPVVTTIFAANSGSLRAGLVVAMASVSNALWTPYGNVNNTIVFSTGVYRFRDFLYFGVPLSILNAVLVPISGAIVFHQSFR